VNTDRIVLDHRSRVYTLESSIVHLQCGLGALYHHSMHKFHSSLRKVVSLPYHIALEPLNIQDRIPKLQLARLLHFQGKYNQDYIHRQLRHKLHHNSLPGLTSAIRPLEQGFLSRSSDHRQDIRSQLHQDYHKSRQF